MPSHHKTKICAQCGQSEKSNWIKHWKNHHAMVQPRELLPGESPVHPIDNNWVFLIKDQKIRHLYQAAISSLPLDAIVNPCQSVQSHQEEEKEEKQSNACEKGDKTEHASSIERQQFIDFKSMHTQQLFNIAIPVFETIIERMNARASAIDFSITQLLNQHKFKPNFERRLQRPNQGNEEVVVNEKMHKLYKLKTRGVPHSIADAKPQIKEQLEQYLKEHTRVKSEIQNIKNVADLVHGLSLPTEFIINQCNAEVVPVNKSLRNRSRKLLRQPPKQVESRDPIQQEIIQESQNEQISSQENKERAFPHLYGNILEKEDTEEKLGSVTIDVNALEEGATIIKGVSAIDRARRDLQLSRQVVKQIQLRKLMMPLVSLCDAWRAQLNRSLQHFLNMVLVPLDQVGEGRTKVTLLLGRNNLSTRSFTVCVMPKEKRAIRGSCSHHLQVLQHVVKNINDTIELIREVALAFNQIMILNKHHILDDLVDTIIDAATALGKDKRMELEHKFSSFQSILKECRDTLQEPDIVNTLEQKKEQRKYWETTPLKEHVQKMMRNIKKMQQNEQAKSKRKRARKAKNGKYQSDL